MNKPEINRLENKLNDMQETIDELKKTVAFLHLFMQHEFDLSPNDLHDRMKIVNQPTGESDE